MNVWHVQGWIYIVCFMMKKRAWRAFVSEIHCVSQRSVTSSLRSLTAHIYYLMIIVTSGFSQKSFFYWYYLYFLEIFWRFLNLFSWNLNTFTKHKEQVFFFLICSIFTCLFRNHSLYYRFPPFRIFPLQVNTWTDSLKWTPLPCQFSWWSISVLLKIRLISAEINMSKLSKVWYQNK